MARFIDADKLLENLKKQYGEDLGWQCTVNMSDIGMMIEDAPTADVVEVVRCSECKFNQYGICDHYVMAHCDIRDDDFCNYGERRTDNDV